LRGQSKYEFLHGPYARCAPVWRKGALRQQGHAGTCRTETTMFERHARLLRLTAVLESSRQRRLRHRQLSNLAGNSARQRSCDWSNWYSEGADAEHGEGEKTQ